MTFTSKDALEICKHVDQQFKEKDATNIDVMSCLCTMIMSIMAGMDLPHADFNILCDAMKEKYPEMLNRIANEKRATDE